MNVISRGIRNAFRNVVRTLSIVVILGLSIGLSLVMLIAHRAVSNKIESVKQSVGNTITIRPAGYVGGSSANNALTDHQLAKVSVLAHVTTVTESISGNLTTAGSSSSPASSGTTKSNGSAGETSLKSPIQLNKSGDSASGGGIMLNGVKDLPQDFSPPISVLGTTNPTGTISELNASITLRSGKPIDGTKDSNEALISESMAKKNNLKVDSTFTAYGATLTVKGIFTSDTEAGNNFVITSLPTLQRLSGNANAVTEATATIDSVSNIDSATAAVKKSLGSSADVTNSKQTVQNAIAPLQSILSVSLYSLAGAVVAGGIIILLTMVMIVRERKREIGVVKALGFSNIHIMVQFMAEALTLTILGAVVGLVMGIIAGNPVTKTLVDSSANKNSGAGAGHMIVNNTVQGVTNIHAEIGWSIILYGLGAAIGIAIIGSALASYFIAKVRPAEVLRSE